MQKGCVRSKFWCCGRGINIIFERGELGCYIGPCKNKDCVFFPTTIRTSKHRCGCCVRQVVSLRQNFSRIHRTFHIFYIGTFFSVLSAYKLINIWLLGGICIGGQSYSYSVTKLRKQLFFVPVVTSSCFSLNCSNQYR